MKIIDPFAEKFSNDLSIVKDLKNLANYMNNECKKFKKRTTVTFQNEIPHNTSDKDIEVKRENVISESALDITRFEDAQGFKVSDQLLINESCVSEGNFDKLLQKILSPPSKFNSSNTEYMGNEILLRNKSNDIKYNYFNNTIIHEMNTPIGIQSYSPWLLSPIAKQQYSNNNSIDDINTAELFASATSKLESNLQLINNKNHNNDKNSYTNTVYNTPKKGESHNQRFHHTPVEGDDPFHLLISASPQCATPTNSFSLSLSTSSTLSLPQTPPHSHTLSSDPKFPSPSTDSFPTNTPPIQTPTNTKQTPIQTPITSYQTPIQTPSASRSLPPTTPIGRQVRPLHSSSFLMSLLYRRWG